MTLNVSSVNNANKDKIGFVICRDPKCSTIYAHRDSKAGTKNLLIHKCREHFPQAAQQDAPFAEATPMAKSIILRGCVDLCLKDKRPYMAVEGKGFEEYTQRCIDVGHRFGRVKASEVLPHRTAVSNNIQQSVDDLRQELEPEILAAMEGGYCALTTDSCTESKSKEKFYTLTAQYVAVVDGKWVMKSKVLFTTRWTKKGQYTSEDVREFLFDTAEAKGYPRALLEKQPFVTDGGSDLVAAFKKYIRLYCFDHFLNVCLTNAFDLKIYQLEIYTPEAKQLIEKVLETVTLLKKKRISRGFVAVMPKGKKRGPFPSKLPLIQLFHRHYNRIKNYVSDGLQDIDRQKLGELYSMLEPFEAILKTCGTSIPASKYEDLMELLHEKDDHSPFQKDLMQNLMDVFRPLEVLKYINDCKGLVTHFKHDITLMSELEKTLKQSCETRWNSLYSTLDAIRVQFDMVIQILMDAEHYSWVQKINKQPLLESLCNLLRPFKEESVHLQAAKSPTLVC